MEFPYYRGFTSRDLIKTPLPKAKYSLILSRAAGRPTGKFLGKVLLPVGDQAYWNLVFNWFYESERVKLFRPSGLSLLDYWKLHQERICKKEQNPRHQRLMLENEASLPGIISPTIITSLVHLLKTPRVIDPFSRYGEVLLSGSQDPEHFQGVMTFHPDEDYHETRLQLLDNWESESQRLISSDLTPVGLSVEGVVDLFFSSITDYFDKDQLKEWLYPTFFSTLCSLYPTLREDGFLALHLREPRLINRLYKEIPLMGFIFHGILYFGDSDKPNHEEKIYVWRKHHRRHRRR